MEENELKPAFEAGWSNYNVAQGLLTYDGRALLVGNDYGGPELVWSLPGGRLEAGEQHPAALRREVLEETGLQVEIGELLYVVDARSAIQRRHYVTCVFELALYEQPVGEPPLDCSKDPAVRAARWVPFAQVAALLQRPSLGEALVAYLYYGPQAMPHRYWSYPEFLNPQWQPLNWPPAGALKG